jgi:ABC-2 type transport system ATP-binding protein
MAESPATIVRPIEGGSVERAGDPVVAEGLVRRFGDVLAVDGIDLRVTDGEIFGFLGPNGAGKSTTVRVLTTLLRPTAGRAWVAGHDVVAEADAVRRSIGVALQEAALDPLMSGRELLNLQAVLHGIPPVEGRERAVKLLQTVGLSAAANRKVRTYSGGMKRRLDLALALMHEPEVMFLDEPTTGLDPNSRAALWEEIRELNAGGTTVFLTTQYMEEADRLCNRVAIIDNGRIVAEGTPRQLKAEIGDPTLRVALGSGADRKTVEEKLMGFGEPVSDSDEFVSVRLHGGAGRVAEVSRALEDAGVEIEGLELHNPTLDDVFHQATGRRLEGSAEGSADAEERSGPPES